MSKSAPEEVDEWLALVEDERLDEINRMLALQALYSAARLSEPDAGKDLLRRLRRASKPDVGRSWFRMVERQRRMNALYDAVDRLIDGM